MELDQNVSRVRSFISIEIEIEVEGRPSDTLLDDLETALEQTVGDFLLAKPNLSLSMEDITT